VLKYEATAVSVFGADIRICSLKHLRAMRRATDRPKDRLGLEQLAIARGDAPAETDLRLLVGLAQLALQGITWRVFARSHAMSVGRGGALAPPRA
jgi:hypothetical protein